MGLDMYLYVEKYESKTQWNDNKVSIKDFYPKELYYLATKHYKDNFLSKETLDDRGKELSRFKCYACHRLLLAQSEILVTQQDIDSKMLNLEKNNPMSTILKTLEKNSSIVEVKQEIENIKFCLKNCQSISETVFVDCSLKYVRQQQQIFYQNYFSLHDHIKSALTHIKTCQANRQRSQERAERTNLHLNFANSYCGMMNSSLAYGFGCFL